MRYSPSEIAPPARDIALEPRVVVRRAEPESATGVPFSPAEGPQVVARGILEDELANARTATLAHGRTRTPRPATSGP